MQYLKINQAGFYAVDIDHVDENSDRGIRQGTVGVRVKGIRQR